MTLSVVVGVFAWQNCLIAGGTVNCGEVGGIRALVVLVYRLFARRRTQQVILARRLPLLPLLASAASRHLRMLNGT